MFSADMRLFNRSGEIEHGQKREHSCLHEGYKEAEAKNRNLQKIREKKEQNEKQDMLGDHVPEKTNRE